MYFSHILHDYIMIIINCMLCIVIIMLALPANSAVYRRDCCSHCGLQRAATINQRAKGVTVQTQIHIHTSNRRGAW